MQKAFLPNKVIILLFEKHKKAFYTLGRVGAASHVDLVEVFSEQPIFLQKLVQIITMLLMSLLLNLFLNFLVFMLRFKRIEADGGLAVFVYYVFDVYIFNALNQLHIKRVIIPFTVNINFKLVKPFFLDFTWCFDVFTAHHAPFSVASGGCSLMKLRSTLTFMRMKSR